GKSGAEAIGLVPAGGEYENLLHLRQLRDQLVQLYVQEDAAAQGQLAEAGLAATAAHPLDHAPLDERLQSGAHSIKAVPFAAAAEVAVSVEGGGAAVGALPA